MSTFPQLFDLLPRLKVVKAYRTTFFFRVVSVHPELFRDRLNLLGFEPLAHLSVGFFELQKLLVTHFIRVGIAAMLLLLALLNRSLQHALLLVFRAFVDHAVHEHLHHDFFLTLASFVLLHLDGEDVGLNLLVLPQVVRWVLLVLLG